VALRRREYDLSRAWCQESLLLARELGDRRRASFVLETMAGLTAARGQHEREFRLVGVVDALREQIGLSVDRAWRDRMAADLAPARRALGPTVAETVAAGRAMSLDQAISYALTTEPIPSHRVEPSPTWDDGAGPLSPREAEAARLIAHRLTNRQIGEALVVTEGTAANYGPARPEQARLQHPRPDRRLGRGARSRAASPPLTGPCPAARLGPAGSPGNGVPRWCRSAPLCGAARAYDGSWRPPSGRLWDGSWSGAALRS
jgi:hypothetical protein